MRTFYSAALAAMLLTACPGPAPVEEGAPDGGGAEQRLGGLWSVDVEVSAPGVFREYQSLLPIAVGDGVLHASAVCPDGTGAVTAQVLEREAPWAGAVTCPVSLPDCERAVMTLRDGSFWIENGSELVAAFNGVLTGCGNGQPMLIRYRGRK